MHRWIQLVLGALLGSYELIAGAQPIPAFSGADGAAANSVASGQGSIIYRVTSLDAGFGDPQRDEFGAPCYGLNDANLLADVAWPMVYNIVLLGRPTTPFGRITLASPMPAAADATDLARSVCPSRRQWPCRYL
jgi:hypothetical protein